MQVNGLREFSSQIASLNGLTGMQGGSFLRGLTEQNQTSVARDALLLSETGKRFSLNTEKSFSLTQTQEEREISNPTLKLVDESLTDAKNILGKMHELATLAVQNTNLTDLERVEIQIEIENLQENLHGNYEALGKSLKSQGLEVIVLDGAKLTGIPDPDTHQKNGNKTSVLDRMRIRIMNGEKWDVRETYSPDGFTLTRVEDDGQKVVIETYEAEAWHVVDEQSQNILTSAPDEDGVWKIVDSDKTVPTVREVLESQTHVIVMDAESATEGVTYLEQQIESVQKWHDEVLKIGYLMAEQESKGMDTTAIKLNIAEISKKVYLSLGPISGASVINQPTKDSYFLSGTKVYKDKLQLSPEVPTNVHSLSLEQKESNVIFDEALGLEEYGPGELSGEALAGVKFMFAGVEFEYGGDNPEIVQVNIPGI